MLSSELRKKINSHQLSKKKSALDVAGQRPSVTLTSGMSATGSEEQTWGVPAAGGIMEESEVCVVRLELWRDVV